MLKLSIVWLTMLALASVAVVVIGVVVVPNNSNVPDNVLTADSEIQINLGVSPASALLTASSMSPGDLVTGQLVLTNNESFSVFSDLTIAVTGDAALASALVLGVKSASCGDGPLLTSAGTVEGAASPLAYFGPYDTISTLMSAVTIAGTASRDVCFNVVLPSGISLASVSGLSTTANISIFTDDIP